MSHERIMLHLTGKCNPLHSLAALDCVILESFDQTIDHSLYVVNVPFFVRLVSLYVNNEDL